jgi:hypothetical protein
VVFHGRGASGQDGIYEWDGATARVLVDRNTAAPGGTGNFTRFLDTLALDGGNVAFGASAPAPALAGDYAIWDGVLTRVRDQSTEIFPGQYSWVCGSSGPTISDNQVALAATYNCEGGGRGGIFVISRSGALSTVADTGTTNIPGTTSRFTSLSFPSIHSGSVAFQGSRSTLFHGIYLSSGGTLSVVADKSTPIPGRTRNFFSSEYNGWPSLYDGSVLFADLWFVSVGVFDAGIYLYDSGRIQPVITWSDQLDGKNLSTNPNIPGLSIGDRSLGANNIAFTAQFADGSAGVFLKRRLPHWWCMRIKWVEDPFFGRYFYLVRCWVIPGAIVITPPIIFFAFRRWRRLPSRDGRAY